MDDPVPERAAIDVQPPKSFTARFVGVFISPRTTFRDIARHPDFIFPLIAVALAALAMTETMLAKIGMERIIRASLEQSGQAAKMSPEQLEQAVERGAGVAGILAHVAGLLGQPIFLLIVAGVGLFILNGLFGAQLNFKTAFSVACYANLPSILGALMGLAVIFFGDPERFNPQSPVPSNVGFFLNPFETSKPLAALASSIDFFTLWLLALLGIGFSEAAGRKVKALPIFLTYFGLWMIWVLGKMGLATLG